MSAGESVPLTFTNTNRTPRSAYADSMRASDGPNFRQSGHVTLVSAITVSESPRPERQPRGAPDRSLPAASGRWRPTPSARASRGEGGARAAERESEPVGCGRSAFRSPSATVSGTEMARAIRIIRTEASVRTIVPCRWSGDIWCSQWCLRPLLEECAHYPSVSPDDPSP